MAAKGKTSDPAKRESAQRRTETRKAARRAVQEARAKTNRERLAKGEPTPWQETERKRREARGPIQAVYRNKISGRA